MVFSRFLDGVRPGPGRAVAKAACHLICLVNVAHTLFRVWVAYTAMRAPNAND